VSVFRLALCLFQKSNDGSGLVVVGVFYVLLFLSGSSLLLCPFPYSLSVKLCDRALIALIPDLISSLLTLLVSRWLLYRQHHQHFLSVLIMSQRRQWILNGCSDWQPLNVM